MTLINQILMKVVRIKETIPAVFILLQFLSLQSVLGQNQMKMTDYITQKFLKYCESVPREEIFVHTDKENYIAGEDLWFNINLIDRQSSHLSVDSKIVYFEVLSPENKPVAQKRIRMDKGSGTGQIELPDTLSTGTYTIRAYTNWMKNFMPYNCFIKDVSVYNALRAKSFKRKVCLPELKKGDTAIDSVFQGSDPALELKVNNMRPDTLEIYVHADEKYQSENKNLFYFFIQTHGIINLISSEKMTGVNTKISFSKSVLTPGINQITIFDFKGMPAAERYIYTPAAKEKQFLVLHSPDSSSTRSKVSLELKLNDESLRDLTGTNLSISVASETNASGILEMNDYLVFGTEFGLLPRTVFKGSKISEFPVESVDSFLLNVTSNWIKWKTILSDEPPEFKYQIERENHSLMGLLLTGEQQLAWPGEFLLLSIPGKVPVFQYSTTNYKAEFSFDIKIDDEVQDIIIQRDNLSKNNKIYFESSFSDLYLPSEVMIDSTGKPVPPFISKQSINYQVEKIYGSSYTGEILNFPPSPVKPRRFYGKPDAEILLKNFIKLPVMEEVFFEIVPHVTLRKTGTDYEMSLVDAFGNKLYDKPPGILIDGVIIKDPSVIGNLDPELVEKIDVVRQQYYVGDYLFNGIVNVITKSGDFANILLPDYATRLAYRVIDPVHKFVSPDYSLPDMRNSRTPDFRNTLYWNPSVKPDKDGKAIIEFWTSDTKSDYEINIQGITSEGKSVSLRKTIKVK